MVEGSRRSVALLAIQPRYASQLMDGSKRVEFRKTKFKQDVGRVFVYASSPVKQVVGFFEVEELVEATPQVLWERYKAVGGIDEADYKAYYGDARLGVAIVVGEVKRFDSPLDLAELTGSAVPPQSFAYLKSSETEQAYAQLILEL